MQRAYTVGPSVLMAAVLLAAASSIAAGSPVEPSFDKLVELNSTAIFGGDLKRHKDRFTLTFPGEGHFERGFDCKGSRRGQIISNLKQVKNVAARKVLIDGHKKGKPSLVALNGGSAISRFELADDYEIRFRMRAPNLDARSQLVWYLNRRGTREMVRSSFFRDIVAGKKNRTRTRNARFAASPGKWFDRGAEGMLVVMTCKAGKVSVEIGVTKMEKKKQVEKLEEVVSATVGGPSGGKIGFSFDRVSFMLSDFRVKGKFPRKGVEAEIARLKKAKKLRTQDKAQAAQKGKPGKNAAPPGKVRRRSRRDPPDLDKPDPEAGEDL